MKTNCPDIHPWVQKNMTNWKNPPFSIGNTYIETSFMVDCPCPASHLRNFRGVNILHMEPTPADFQLPGSGGFSNRACSGRSPTAWWKHQNLGFFCATKRENHYLLDTMDAKTPNVTTTTSTNWGRFYWGYIRFINWGGLLLYRYMGSEIQRT